MSIQEEIHKAMAEIQKNLNNGESLSDEEISNLFLTALIEEEA